MGDLTSRCLPTLGNLIRSFCPWVGNLKEFDFADFVTNGITHALRSIRSNHVKNCMFFTSSFEFQSFFERVILFQVSIFTSTITFNQSFYSCHQLKFNVIFNRKLCIKDNIIYIIYANFMQIHFIRKCFKHAPWPSYKFNVQIYIVTLRHIFFKSLISNTKL